MPIERSARGSEPSGARPHARDAILFVLDARGCVRLASNAAVQLAGAASADAPVWELPGFNHHSDVVAWLRASVVAATSSVSPHMVEATIGDSDNARTFVLSLGRVPSSADGTPLLVLEVIEATAATRTSIEPELTVLGAGLALLAEGADTDGIERESLLSENRFRMAFEQDGAIELLADAQDGRILDVSPTAAAFYGWPRETMRSMVLLDLDSTSVPEWRTLAHAIVTGASRRVPLQHRVASGAIQSVDAYGRRLTIDGRQVLHIVVRDATERLRADRLSRESEAGERIIRKLRAVCELAANTAHEFNSLLTVIAGSAGFLRQDLAGHDRQLEDIASIERASKRAEELTKHLLTSVRSELPRTRTVDLRGQLQDAMPAIRARVGLNIHVVLLPVASPVLARLETDALPDVFWTLIDYAKAGMPTGGVLTFGTELIERDEDGGRARYAVLCMTDTCTDVREAALAHIVEVLRSATPFRGSAGGAAGAVGFVSVNAIPAGGTAFRLHFPAAQSMPTTLPTAPRTERERRVVLVSREPLLRDITRRMLQKLNVDVLLVESGDEAIAALDADAGAAWDVVTDVNVRGTSGIALIDALRSRTTSVVLLVGSDLESGVRRALETRAVQRLDKPFTIVELEQALRAARAAGQDVVAG